MDTGLASTNPQSNLKDPAVMSPVAANTLTKEQYAARAGVPVTQVLTSPSGQFSIGDQSTTVLSSDKSKDIGNITNTTNNLAKTGVTTDTTTGITTDASGKAYTPSASVVSTVQNADGSVTTSYSDGSVKTTSVRADGTTATGGYSNGIYYPPGSAVPKDASGNPMTLSPTDPQNDAILKGLNDQIASNDAYTAALVAGIKAQYERLIQQQEQANRGAEGGLTTFLLKAGALQGTASGQGTLQGQISYGLQQIADLNAKEQNAIIQAQQAGQDKDFRLQDQINQNIQNTRQEKQAAAAKLSDQILAMNEKIADQKREDDKSIQSIAAEAAKNGASSTVINQITSAKSISEALTSAGSWLQTATGQLGDYLQYKRETQNKGLTPEDYSAWKAKEDAAEARKEANKAYSTAYASAKGRLAAESAFGGGGGAAGGNTVQNLAQQLVNGNLAPSELSKRATGTAAYNEVLKAADAYSMATTGKHFNIAQADRNYKFANQPTTQTTLNYLKSLIGTADENGNLVGGNLDELRAISDQINRTKFPALNNAKAWAKLATGDPRYAQYQAVATEVADQVAKILQGGTGGGGTSDAKLQQAQNLFNTGFSKAQINGIIDAMQPLLLNRAKSIVGDNPYLNDYASDLGISNSMAISPKQAVLNYGVQHPEARQKILDLYKLPGWTDQDVLDYVNNLR